MAAKLASPSSTPSPIRLLSTTNWYLWRPEMEMQLQMAGLWGHVSGSTRQPVVDEDHPDPSAVKEETRWIEREGKARATILYGCEPVLRHKVSASTKDLTVANMWSAMQSKYSKPNRAVMATVKFAMSIKACPEGSDVVAHAAWLQRENDKLIGSRMEFDDFNLALHLLATLPPSYTSFRQSFISRADEDFTFDAVYAALVEEQSTEQLSASYARLSTRGREPSAAVTAMATTATAGKHCKVHGFGGHSDAECKVQQGGKQGSQSSSKGKRYPKESANSSTANERATSDSDEDAFVVIECPDGALSATSATTPAPSRAHATDTTWMVDSAATHHFCISSEHMTNYRPSAGQVRLGDGRNVAIAGIGDIRALLSHEGSAPTPVTLKAVRHVPSLSVNLLSVACMDAEGLSVSFSKKACVIRRRQRVVAKAPLDGTGHYTLTTRPRSDTSAHAATIAVGTDTDDELRLWHHRLGHLHAAAVRLIFTKEMGTGVDCAAIAASIRKQAGPKGQLRCDSCLIGKSHRLPFTPSTSRAKAPLALVHTDLNGPVTHGLYVQVVVDDATRLLYTKVHANKQSDTVLTALKHYKSWAEARQHPHGHRLLAIRSDGGGEFHSTAAQQWYAAHGIDAQTTTAHTSQTNGVAERAHRTLMDRVRTILNAAGLSDDFWAEALMYAAYTINRCPSKALGAMTPYEAWTGTKPDLSRLHPFGCVVFRHITATDRAVAKLSPRAARCAMMGYTNNKEAYLLWDPTVGRVVTSRDVTFRDDEWWSDPARAGRGGTPLPPSIVSNNTSRTGLDDPDGNSDDSDDDDAEQKRQNGQDGQHEVDEADYDSDRDLEPLSNLIAPPQSALTAPPRHPPELRDHNSSGSGRDVPSIILPHRLRPRAAALAASSVGLERYRGARQAEMDSLHKASTYTLVPRPNNANVVGCKWVDKEKPLPDGTVKLKSRLVAQGFTQRPGIDFDETYSPTVRMDSLRTLLALAAHHDWDIHHMDVRSAYLNGTLRETIYMRQPKGFEVQGKEDHVCLLHKGLYGLKQAGRAWHQTIDPALQRIGLTPLASDHCVYQLSSPRHTFILALYVDDLFLFASSLTTLSDYKKQLHALFEMEDLGEARLILGTRLTRDRVKRTITLSQADYVTGLLKRFDAADLNPAATPMEAALQLARCPTDHQPSAEDITRYQSTVGALMYAACVTRPDITYAVTVLAQYSARPHTSHFNALKRVLRYLRGTTDQTLTYTGTSDPTPLLVGYTDSDWANNQDDRRSVTGYVFTLSGGPISWNSRRQHTIAQSSVEAEYMAMAESVKEAIWLRRLLGELSHDITSPTPLHADNTGSIALAGNPEHHARTKHIDVKYHLTREHLERGTIALLYVPTKDNTADVFTKALPRPAYVQHCAALGLALPSLVRGGVLDSAA